MIAALVLTSLAFVGVTWALLAGYFWFLGLSALSEDVISGDGFEGTVRFWLGGMR
jgi:hypothetical protein